MITETINDDTSYRLRYSFFQEMDNPALETDRVFTLFTDGDLTELLDYIEEHSRKSSFSFIEIVAYSK